MGRTLKITLEQSLEGISPVEHSSDKKTIFEKSPNFDMATQPNEFKSQNIQNFVMLSKQ